MIINRKKTQKIIKIFVKTLFFNVTLDFKGRNFVKYEFYACENLS